MRHGNDSEQANHSSELEQTVRAHVAQLSTETGLQEPVVDVVPFLTVRPPRINAHFSKPEGVPTIRITERTVQELPHRVLRFLLAHEFGHFANWDFRDKAPRRFWAILLLAVVACVFGAVFEIAGIGGSMPGFLMLWVGVATLVGSPLVFQARCRVDEYRVDAFAARLSGDLGAAREYFAALDQDQPKRSSDLAFRPWFSHPPLRDRLAAVEKILARKNSERSAP